MTTTLKTAMGEAGAFFDASYSGDKLQTVMYQIITELEDLRGKFNAHTHKGDGAQGATYNTSGPQSDTATITVGTAVSVTKIVQTA